MRDSNRIDEVLELIWEAWKQNPDLRLGQLLLSATGIQCAPLFYMEEDELCRQIVAWHDGKRDSVK